MYILNTGLGFRLGFAVVARWMDARTRAKFVVFSGGESQVRQDLHHQEGWHFSCERGCTRDDYGKAGPNSVERLKVDLPFVNVLCV